MSIAVLPLPQPPTCPNAGCLGPSAVGRATAAPPPRPPGPRALELRGGRRREPRGRPPAVPRRRAIDGAQLEKGGHQGTDRIGGSARVGKLSTPPPLRSRRLVPAPLGITRGASAPPAPAAMPRHRIAPPGGSRILADSVSPFGSSVMCNFDSFRWSSKSLFVFYDTLFPGIAGFHCQPKSSFCK